MTTHDLALARTNFVVFCETVIVDEKTGAPIQLAPHPRTHHDPIDLAIESGDYLFALAPIRHGKTSILESLVLFVLGRDPTARAKVVCANQDRARERVNKIRKVLLRSGRYRALFPGTRVVGRGRTDRIHLQLADGARDPALDACGVTTGVEGASVDLLLLDDCDDRRSQDSDSRRREVRRAVVDTFLNRCEPGSAVLAIGTRWSPDDLFGHFANDDEARSAWRFVQLDIRDDLSCIQASAIGERAPILLPVGWQTSLLPEHEIVQGAG